MAIFTGIEDSLDELVARLPTSRPAFAAERAALPPVDRAEEAVRLAPEEALRVERDAGAALAARVEPGLRDCDVLREPDDLREPEADVLRAVDALLAVFRVVVALGLLSLAPPRVLLVVLDEVFLVPAAVAMNARSPVRV